MSPTTNPKSEKNRYIVTGFDCQAEGLTSSRPDGGHDHLIIYTLEGRGYVTHKGGHYTVEPHDVLLLEPGYPHSYTTDPGAEKWLRLWAHFMPPAAWSLWMNWSTVAPGHRCFHVDDARAQQRITDALRRAHTIASGYHRHREPLALNALESALLWCDEVSPHGNRPRLDPRVRATIDYICRHIDRPLTLADLADHCNLSPSRLSALFREQMDMTPHQFLDRHRLERARQLLERSGQTVSEIAYSLGYNNPFYFTRRFTTFTGQSPRAYRNAASV